MNINFTGHRLLVIIGNMRGLKDLVNARVIKRIIKSMNVLSRVIKSMNVLSRIIKSMNVLSRIIKV